MAKLVPLNPQMHGAVRVNSAQAAAVAAKDCMIPVVEAEFLKLVLEYPIVFSKNGESGKFVCVALTGFARGENLFCRAGRWDALYLPLNVARQPFFIDIASAKREEYAIYVDMENPAVATDRGDPVFHADGRDTDYLHNIKSRLAALVQGEASTQALLDILLELHLLTPLTLDITFANDQQQRIQGIYGIDEARLDSLSADILARLHENGWLKSIYLMVASVGHIYSLIQRKNALLAAVE